jgi:hypothetical protein
MGWRVPSQHIWVGQLAGKGHTAQAGICSPMTARIDRALGRTVNDIADSRPEGDNEPAPQAPNEP